MTPFLTLLDERLRTLKLAKLKLGGEIPKAIGRCMWLAVLELQDNWLTGKVPDTLGKCACLETLALHGNTLGGSVPWYAIARRTGALALSDCCSVAGGLALSTCGFEYPSLPPAALMVFGSLSCGAARRSPG